MGLPAPPASKISESARNPTPSSFEPGGHRFHPVTPSSSDVSHALEGLILAVPCSLVSCCCRSWGFCPSEPFPSTQLYSARHRTIPSRRSPARPLSLASRSVNPVHRTMQNKRPRPQGFVSRESPYPRREYCIPAWADALLSFHRLHGFSCPEVEWLRRPPGCPATRPLIRP